jgi:hypothetical protein
MKLSLLLLLLPGSFFLASAQSKINYVVTGKLLDSLINESMVKASVSVLSPKDSSIVSFTLTNAKGEFQIKDLDKGDYSLLITYLGYQSVKKNFVLSATMPLLNFGIINMESKIAILREVIVEALPMEVKKDTVEYRASAFKTRPNAMAEDLLKKLPGVDVDREGNIKAQGEEIQKIYVDGKEFFSSDLKIATKNITADMIESVQVYNDMSDQAKFTHIDDGSRIKTINIKLKKNRQNGFFGKASAGYGTSNRNQTALTYNNFNGDRRTSFIGGFNNVNDIAFSVNDIVNKTGGNVSGGESIPVASGISTSRSAGFNYINRLGTKLNITGSYFYSQIENRSQTTGLLQSFFPGDSMTIRKDESEFENKSQNHSFNLCMEYALDSNNSMLYTSSLINQKLSGNDTDTSFTRSVNSGSDILNSKGVIKNRMETNGINMNNNFLYRRRFSKLGRTFTLGFNNTINNSDGNSTNQSLITFYSFNSSIRSLQNQNIKNLSSNRGNNNIVSISYTEPVGKMDILEFNYSYTNNYTTFDRNAFNYDSLTGRYDNINPQITNFFENGFQANRYGANFKIQTKNYGLQFGCAMQTSQLVNKINHAIYNTVDKDSTVILKQNSINFFPAVSYNYSFSGSKNLRINYYGRTQQPGVIQLQQIPDITNPLQVRIGNPFLHQEYTNDLDIAYNTFNASNFSYFNVSLNASNTSNKIVNSIDTVPKGILDNIPDKNVQLIRPINVNGTFSISSDMTLEIPLRKLNGSSYSFTNSLFFNRGISKIYKQKNIIDQLVITQTATLNLNVKDQLNVELSAYVSYNAVVYSIQKNFNTRYFSEMYTVDLNYYLFKNLLFYTNFVYSANNNGLPGYNNSFSLWNASLASHFFKKKNGALKLSVNDILNQNKSIVNTVAENYISYTKTSVLPRYLMLSFTYNFNGAGTWEIKKETLRKQK